MPLESHIQNSIRLWISDNFVDPQVRVVRGSAYGVRGDPDMLACIRGTLVVIETKQKGKRATKIQKKKLCDWAKAGAIAIEADSLHKVKDILSPASALPERAGYVYLLKENPFMPE